MVPKAQLRPAGSGSWSGHAFLLVTVETTELKLPSSIEAIDKAATAVAEFVTRSGIDEEAAFGIDMAVREAIANAVIHGNKLDETKLVEINVKSSLDSLEINVHDQGQGFNPDTISDPTREENILKTSGRGIFFHAHVHGRGRLVNAPGRWYDGAHVKETVTKPKVAKSTAETPQSGGTKHQRASSWRCDRA